jgi:hypothetical protein
MPFAFRTRTRVCARVRVGCFGSGWPGRCLTGARFAFAADGFDIIPTATINRSTIPIATTLLATSRAVRV